MPHDTVRTVHSMLSNFQQTWTDTLGDINQQPFETHHKTLPHLNGKTRLIMTQGGPHIERASFNVSCIEGGKLPEAAFANSKGDMAGRPYQATGISGIIHPRNPYVPTTHMNVRFFRLLDDNGETADWWFGGGFDLTPYYAFEEDCRFWHEHALAACEPFGDWRYDKYKKWADEYFYLKHRQECRGIGGLFYDQVNDLSLEDGIGLTESVANHFYEAYSAILTKRLNHPYGERERAFQLQRRGRYVEFNLLQDRGTLFGLQSNGDAESILVSMPPEVTWEYEAKVKVGSPEEKLLREILPPRDWLERQQST